MRASDSYVYMGPLCGAPLWTAPRTPRTDGPTAPAHGAGHGPAGPAHGMGMGIWQGIGPGIGLINNTEVK